MKYKWKSVLISGGGSGIGFCLAKTLAGQGGNIALIDLRISNDVKAELQSLNPAGQFSYHEADLRDSKAVGKAVNEAVNKIGALELGINSAGIQIAKTFLELPEEEFNRVVNINLLGSRNFAAAVLPQLKSGGQLALIASLAGVVTNYTYTAYCASKFGVVGMAGALRTEFKPQNIAVSVICPPEILTAMVVEELKSMHPITRELKAFADTIPLESACDEMLNGIAQKKFMIIPGSKARLTWRLSRWVPWLLEGKVDKVVAKMYKQTN